MPDYKAMLVELLAELNEDEAKQNSDGTTTV